MKKFILPTIISVLITVSLACDMSKLNGCWKGPSNTDTFCKKDTIGNNYCNIYYAPGGSSQSFCQATLGPSGSVYSAPVNDGTCPRCQLSCNIYKNCSGGDGCATCTQVGPIIPNFVCVT